MDHRGVAVRLAELYQNWGPGLLRYAATLTHSISAAEDLVQEAFLALQHRWTAGEEIANPRGWTIVTVRNLALKRHRGQSRVVAFPRTELAAAPARDDILALRALLAKLTEREQEVLLLRMESLEYKEIALELGIAPGTVSALIARALSKLRQAARSSERKEDDGQAASH